MVLSNIESELRQIIEMLRTDDLENARGRTVELIESVLRMSNPMYRENTNQSGSSGGPARSRAPGTLLALVQQLREVCFAIRRGTPTDALLIAERAAALFLNPETPAHSRP